MAQFRIEFDKQSSGFAIVEAETKEEAEEKFYGEDFIDEYEHKTQYEIISMEKKGE